jgi:hypothetical protein
MTDRKSPDALDLLRAANPVPEDMLPLPAESEAAQQVYERITGTPYTGKRVPQSRFRHRRFLPPIAAIFVALSVGGIAAYSFSSTTVTHHFAVECYSQPNLSSGAAAVDATSAGPVATCSQAWREGHVGSGPLPLLVACITPQGVAAVFPSVRGADVCGQLGLPALPAGSTSLTTGATSTTSSTALTAEGLPTSLRDAIVSQLRSSCQSADQAKRILTILLTKAAVPWHVVVPTPFPADHPCASPGFDEANQEIVLTGIPPT